MTRINSNIPSLIAQKSLARSNTQLQEALVRLSTGLRINVGKDDPSGLIASEVLRSDIINVQQAITNSERANQVIATADSALGQVSALLNDIRGLVSEAANTGAISDEQIAADQLQVDSSLESIDRIARVTSFAGRRLLDGSLDFITTSSGTVEANSIALLGGTTGVSANTLTSGGTANSEIIITVATAGTAGNSVSISFVSGVAAGSETVTFAGGSLTFTIASGTSTANQIISALNGSSLSGQFAAALATGSNGSGAFAGATDTSRTSGGIDGNQLVLSAASAGSQFTNVTIQFATGGSTGSESATFNSSTSTLTITIQEGASTTEQVRSAINAEGTFSATIASGSNASGTYSSAATITATTSGGFSETQLSNLQIDQANFGTQTQIAVSVQLDSQATRAQLTYSAGTLAADLSLEVGGAQGFEVFNFGNTSTIAQIATAINLVSDATGVSAGVSGTDLVLTSQEFGSNAFVSIRSLTSNTAFDTFDTSGASISRTNGTDVQVRVNGVQASGDGLVASINTSTLDLSFAINERITAGTTVSFTITGGGANFQLGPDVVSNQQARLGIQGVSTATLGGVSGTLFELRSGGAKALADDPVGAAKVVDQVISKVTGLRGRLGAFQKTTLETNIITLSNTLENLSDAESSIRDADFAAESARLTRAQILVQAGISVLAIANSNPQNVLALLR